jgi:glycosyltransferase involved in cell wall biosynthesis
VVADGVRRSALGVLVRPGDVAALARAIELTLADPTALRDAATQARSSARERFTVAGTARTVQAAWARALPDIGGARQRNLRQY